MKHLIIFTALVALIAPLHAQTAKSRADLYSEIDSSLASGSNITALQLRTVIKNAVASADNATTDGSRVSLSGSNAFLSGAAVTFNAGSTLTVNGTFSGTPTGGTFDFSNMTLFGLPSGDVTLAGSQTFTGQNTFTLSPNVFRTDLGVGTALARNMHYYANLSSARTLTFSGSDAEGDTRSVKATVSGSHTLAFPSSKRVGSADTAITSLTLYPGVHLLTWVRIGGEYVLLDSVGKLDNTAATAAPTVSDDAADGYEPGSLWINATGETAYVLIKSTVGAAVWKQIDGASGSGATWGSITGTLGDQADLVSALGGKINTSAIDTSAGLTTNSTSDVPSTSAVRSYVNSAVGAGAPVGLIGLWQTANIGSLASGWLRADGTNSTPDLSLLNPSGLTYVIRSDVVADNTFPLVSSSEILSSGTKLRLTMSENVEAGADGWTGFSLSPSGDPVTLTYDTGTGTSQIDYDISRAIVTGETATLTFVPPTAGVRDLAGNYLEAFAGASVTNGSGYTTALFHENFEGSTYSAPRWTISATGIGIADPNYTGAEVLYGTESLRQNGQFNTTIVAQFSAVDLNEVWIAFMVRFTDAFPSGNWAFLRNQANSNQAFFEPKSDRVSRTHGTASGGITPLADLTNGLGNATFLVIRYKAATTPGGGGSADGIFEMYYDRGVSTTTALPSLKGSITNGTGGPISKLAFALPNTGTNAYIDEIWAWATAFSGVTLPQPNQ